MESKNKNEGNISDLTKRFLEEVERMGVSFYNIAKNTDVKEAMFTKIKRGTQEPSKKFLARFAECFPEANMEYIYLGKKEDEIDDCGKNEKTKNKTTSSREILQFITENEGITLSKLSQLMGIKRAQPLYDIRDGKIKAISVNYVDKILAAFPKYNRVWLITGEGDPLQEVAENNEVKNPVTERFVETYKEMGLTGYRMGKDCSSITKQKISNIENGITEATIDIVSNFCEAYPQVNANYILTGKGPMFLEGESSGSSSLEPDWHTLYQSAISMYESMFDQLQVKFDELEKAMREAKETFNLNRKKAV